MLVSHLVPAALLLASGAAQKPPGPTPLPGYTLFAPLSDEFDGDTLDRSKWNPTSPGWPGRQPGLFDPSNVRVAGGYLQLWAFNATRNASWPAGFDNYTTSAVHSVVTTRLGFFEIKWRTGSSAISSSWWFHANDGNGTWTEIDVFETTGATNPDKGGANASDFPSHVHVFSLPGTPPAQLPARCACTESHPGSSPCSKGNTSRLPSGARLADAFHTAQLNWTETGVDFLLDFEHVATLLSPCLVQPIGMDFDRETMPGWMSLPPPAELPDSPFLVDYVRAWVHD